MKFRNMLLIATLLFSLNVLLFYLSKHTKRHPSSTLDNRLATPFPYTESEDIVKYAKAIKIKLLENFSWSSNAQKVSLIFTNVIFSTSNKNFSDLCETFPYTEISLQAHRVTINGEHPGIVIQTPCQLSNDHLVNFEIELKEVFTQSPTDKAFTHVKTRFELRNFDNYWPKDWILKSIKFYNKSLDGFSLNNYELYSYLGYNLEFNSTN